MTAETSDERGDGDCLIECIKSIKIIPPPRLRRCITTTLSDSQLQSIERESANRSLFARELVVGTLSQTLPELTQQQQQQQQQRDQQQQSSSSLVQTPASSTTTATPSPDTPNASSNVSTKKSPLQEPKRDQGGTTATVNKSAVPTSTQQQQQQTHLVQGASSVSSGLPSQGLPSNPNGVATAQNNPIVQTLMHSVLPPPLVSVSFLFFPIIQFIDGGFVKKYH